MSFSCEHHIMLCPSHAGVRLHAVYGVIRRCVRAAHVGCDLCGLDQASTFPRREDPQLVSKCDEDIRLIEGAPIRAIFAHRLDHFLCKAIKSTDGLRRLKPSQILEPLWMSEMMQSDEWPNASAVQGSEHLLVSPDSRAVPNAFTRFDAAPFHGKSKCV